MLALTQIVVATDFSPAAAGAFRLARGLADAFGARLTLVHALAWPDAGPFEVPGDAPTATLEEAGETAAARAALASFAGDSGAEVVVVRGRVPARVVNAVAREAGADLVVLGASGGRPSRALLGSVAAELVQTAPCDVLIVPHADEPGADERGAVPRRVVVGIDFSARSRALAGVGVALARTIGAEAALVHVLEPLPHPFRWLDEAVLNLTPEVHARAAEALRELAGDVDEDIGAGASPGLYVERGAATRTLVRVAEALGADLALVGPHGDRPLFDRLLGNVAEGVARRAPCPVWIARRSAEPGPDDEAADPLSYALEPPDGAPREVGE